MTRVLPMFFLGLLAPAIAEAHPGHHDGMSLAQAAQHLLTQPDHLGLIAGVAALAVAGWPLFRRWAPR